MSSPLLILGMHRSGTSCLAGCLEAGGLALGTVNTAASHNARGNRENEAIRDVHDRILAYHGYTWDRPPPHQLSWRPLDFDALVRVTGDLAKKPIWGLKDPRTVFCLDGWKKQFNPRLIVTFRHPQAVAASLMKRADAWITPMSRDLALGLWTAYNREILQATRATDTQFISYDETASDYRASISRLANHFGLNADRATKFYSESLTHEKNAGEPIPEFCQKTWNGLLERMEMSLA